MGFSGRPPLPFWIFRKSIRSCVNFDLKFLEEWSWTSSERKGWLDLNTSLCALLIPTLFSVSLLLFCIFLARNIQVHSMTLFAHGIFVHNAIPKERAIFYRHTVMWMLSTTNINRGGVPSVRITALETVSFIVRGTYSCNFNGGIVSCWLSWTVKFSCTLFSGSDFLFCCHRTCVTQKFQFCKIAQRIHAKNLHRDRRK